MSSLIGNARVDSARRPRAAVPAHARELAARLSALFDKDSGIAARLNGAQRRLRHANDRLWSGLAPDAFGLIYDGAAPAGHSQLAELIGATVAAGGPGPRVAVTPATKAGASATDSNAKDANKHDPPAREPRPRLSPLRHSPYGLGLRDDSRGSLPTGQSGNINTNNNRRQVGPLQAIAPGPVQAIVFNGVELRFGDGAEVEALGEVLAQQPVGVLVAAALPGCVWVAEVDVDVGVDVELFQSRQRRPGGRDRSLLGVQRLRPADARAAQQPRDACRPAASRGPSRRDGQAARRSCDARPRARPAGLLTHAR